jgi:hypothetical protein
MMNRGEPMTGNGRRFKGGGQMGHGRRLGKENMNEKRAIRSVNWS